MERGREGEREREREGGRDREMQNPGVVLYINYRRSLWLCSEPNEMTFTREFYHMPQLIKLLSLRLRDTHVGMPTCFTNIFITMPAQLFSAHTTKPAVVGRFVSYQLSRQKSRLRRVPASSFSREKYSSMSSSVLRKLF